MMRNTDGGLAVALFATACGQPFDEDDGALGCDLPMPCDVVSLQEMGLELEPREAAECMYEVIASGERAHLRQEFITLSESYYDLYIEQLDCSNGDGAPRVCSGMINWCNSMAMIEPTCP
jgi:hypothetical protein